MDTEYWKTSPFGENSIFHPSWEEKEKERRRQKIEPAKITGIKIERGTLKEDSYDGPRYDNLDPQKYLPDTMRYSFVKVSIIVTIYTSGYASTVFVAIDNDWKQARQAYLKTGTFQKSFTVQIPSSKRKGTFVISAKIADSLDSTPNDMKKYKVEIDDNGCLLKKNEIPLRKDIKTLKPSSLFYFTLKELEGHGGKDVIENGHIVKFKPYDDGGQGKGNATIGYGHLIDKKPFDSSDPKHKKWANGISADEAEALLVQDVEKKISDLERLIKVNLFQYEYDALLLCLFNGGMRNTLITTINKGVENLSPEEIFTAFLAVRKADGKESDGLIYRRSREAEIFVYNNYTPYPSEKFENKKAFINAFKKFLSTGILPLLFLILSSLFPACKSNSAEQIVTEKQHTERHVPDSTNEVLLIDTDYYTYRFQNLDDKQYTYRYKHYIFTSEYQYNDILFDSNDSLLMQMDTVLEYGTPSHYYNISIKKKKVTVSVERWGGMPAEPIVMHGYQKDGFIYIRDEQGDSEMSYKIIPGKCLFIWNPYNRLWFVITPEHITQNKDIFNHRLKYYQFCTGNIQVDIPNGGGNKYDEILFDSNDRLLMQMDTVLEFSTCQTLYKVIIRKDSATICVKDWITNPSHPQPSISHGFHKDGFIYTRDEATGLMVMRYKIVLGKCLFVWIPYTGWASIPCWRKGVNP